MEWDALDGMHWMDMKDSFSHVVESQECCQAVMSVSGKLAR